MAFAHCAACPSPGQCSESIPPDGFKAPIPMNGPDKPGMCWNAYMNVRQYEAQRGKAPALPDAVGVADPRLAQHPVAQANAASWPSGSPAKAPSKPQAPRSVRPAGGSVTEQIFAACDAVFARLNAAAGNPAELSAAAREGMLKEARLAAIPELVAAGVNINSARKGSSMWVAARL